MTGQLAQAVRIEIDAYLQATQLKPGFDYTIEVADETDPLAALQDNEPGKASAKQFRFLKWRIDLLRKEAREIIPDPELDEQAQLILSVYEMECVDGNMTSSRASSMIEATNDLLLELGVK